MGQIEELNAFNAALRDFLETSYVVQHPAKEALA